jgi:hypothetical protein
MSISTKAPHNSFNYQVEINEYDKKMSHSRHVQAGSIIFLISMTHLALKL